MDEPDLTLTEAAPLARSTPETLRQWIKAGRTIKGKRFYLKADFVGGRWLTKALWVREFREATTAARRGVPETAKPTGTPPKAGQWQQERDAAAKILGGRK